MLKGILRPRPDSADPWTLPAAMASRGALLGEVKSLYPNRVIWVDYSVEAAGDGSYSRPFQSLDVVFGDDTLECVCQHLCADKITVRVKGPVDVSAGAMDGNNRHYARHLVIRPWNDGERLEVRRMVFSDTREEGPLTASMRIGGDMVYNLHGVKWLDTDFKYILKAYYIKGENQVSVAGSAFCLRECHHLVLVDCSFSIEALTVALDYMDDFGSYLDEIGGGDGEGNGGGWGDDDDGGGGGGDDGGWPHYPWPGLPGLPIFDYPWPSPSDDPGEDPTLQFSFDAHLVLCALQECNEAIIRDTAISLSGRAYNTNGSIVEVAGLMHCRKANIIGLSCSNLAKAHTEAIERYNFSASAVAVAVGIYNSRNSSITAFTTNQQAAATVSATAINGIAQAVAHGVLKGIYSTLADCVVDVFTESFHPVHYSFLRASYYAIDPSNRGNLQGNCLVPEQFGRLWI